jgi:hypothetical protein
MLFVTILLSVLSNQVPQSIDNYNITSYDIIDCVNCCVDNNNEKIESGKSDDDILQECAMECIQ